MWKGGNCAFPQNFHTSKLSEIVVFFAVKKDCISRLEVIIDVKKTLEKQLFYVLYPGEKLFWKKIGN